MLDKKSIIEAKDNRTGVLAVPMWGGEVILKSPSLKDSDHLSSLLRKAFDVKGDKLIPIKGEEAEKAYRKYRLYAVGFSLADEKGERLFSDQEIETTLAKKSPESIAFIFENLEEAFKKKILTEKGNSDSD
jgi:hypothetical protein